MIARAKITPPISLEGLNRSRGAAMRQHLEEAAELALLLAHNGGPIDGGIVVFSKNGWSTHLHFKIETVNNNQS